MEPKPVFWMGSSRKDLKQLPEDVKNIFGFALWQAQNGDRHEDAKILKGFGGGGVLEVIDDHKGNAFRVIYTVKFAKAVYVLHAFQKKSKKGIKTPKSVNDLVHKRLKQAEVHHEKWQTENERKEKERSAQERSHN